MKMPKLIAALCALALSAPALAAGVEVRELKTNQIPENPAKLVDIVPVDTDRSVVTEDARRDEVHAADLRPQIPRGRIGPVGAPIAPMPPPAVHDEKTSDPSAGDGDHIQQAGHK